MALYNVQNVIDKVKILIEEAADTEIITENQLISAVSDAQKWVAAETGCYRDWGTITLLESTVRYSAPTSSSGVLALEYNYGGDQGVRNLVSTDPNNVPHSPDTNFPYFWHFQGEEISVFPSLSPLPSNVTVNVLFSKIPAALTALTDNLTIPDDFQIVVPYHVAKVVAIKDNQIEKASFFNGEIQRLTAQTVAQYEVGRTGVAGPGGSQGAEG